jgi:hypothetical protein
VNIVVDWSKVKKEFIPANDVPTAGRGAQSPWDEIFNEIPKGQAWVLHEPEVNAGTVRGALKRMHKRGKFKYIRFSTKGIHGNAMIYLTNTEKPGITLTPTRRPRPVGEQQDDTKTS